MSLIAKKQFKKSKVNEQKSITTKNERQTTKDLWILFQFLT